MIKLPEIVKMESVKNIIKSDIKVFYVIDEE
jgi:hypothetical protein